MQKVRTKKSKDILTFPTFEMFETAWFFVTVRNIESLFVRVLNIQIVFYSEVGEHA